MSRRDQDWSYDSTGNPRGYIQPDRLQELWFHTGTVCNLRCPFCLEGSKPGDNRLNPLTLEDVKPFIQEAKAMGVEQFSFTGVEPFVIPDMVSILHHALGFKPCMVLTNATEPLLKGLHQVVPLANKPFPLSFRVSLDHPDSATHDAGRGQGNFHLSLKVMEQLHRHGFQVSIARKARPGKMSMRSTVPMPRFLRVPDCPRIQRHCISRIPRTGLQSRCAGYHAVLHDHLKDRRATRQFYVQFQQVGG